MPLKSTVKTHPEYRKILRMIRAGTLSVPAIAKKFGLSAPAVFRFRGDLRRKEKPRKPTGIPASVGLRSQALHSYIKARRHGNGGGGRPKQHGATLEQKAIDLEDMEDYVWALDRPLAPSEGNDIQELTIRQDMARLDEIIQDAIATVTNGRKPRRLLGAMGDRELLVARFREVLRERQEWRRLQRKQWKASLSTRLYETRKEKRAGGEPGGADDLAS